jgi:hypothetical protein
MIIVNLQVKAIAVQSGSLPNNTPRAPPPKMACEMPAARDDTSLNDLEMSHVTFRPGEAVAIGWPQDKTDCVIHMVKI